MLKALGRNQCPDCSLKRKGRQEWKRKAEGAQGNLHRRRGRNVRKSLCSCVRIDEQCSQHRPENPVLVWVLTEHILNKRPKRECYEKEFCNLSNKTSNYRKTDLIQHKIFFKDAMPHEMHVPFLSFH